MKKKDLERMVSFEDLTMLVFLSNTPFFVHVSKVGKKFIWSLRGKICSSYWSILFKLLKQVFSVINTLHEIQNQSPLKL